MRDRLEDRASLVVKNPGTFVLLGTQKRVFLLVDWLCLIVGAWVLLICALQETLVFREMATLVIS